MRNTRILIQSSDPRLLSPLSFFFIRWEKRTKHDVGQRVSFPSLLRRTPRGRRLRVTWSSRWSCDRKIFALWYSAGGRALARLTPYCQADREVWYRRAREYRSARANFCRRASNEESPRPREQRGPDVRGLNAESHRAFRVGLSSRRERPFVRPIRRLDRA